jgi:hypothetical protein
VRSAPCTWRREAHVSWLSLKSKIGGFLWFVLKIGGDGFSGLDLKTSSSDLVIWVSKSPRWFLGLSLKTKQASVAPQNQWREDGTRHASRSGGLLCLKASRARVFQSGIKTDGGATAGGARGTITEIASGSS